MSGTPRGGRRGGVEVRPLTEDDLEECEALCKQVHGFERTGALRDAMQAFAPFVAVRDGRIVAYATTLTFWPMALRRRRDRGRHEGAAARRGGGRWTSRSRCWCRCGPGLFRWCLEQGCAPSSR